MNILNNTGQNKHCIVCYQTKLSWILILVTDDGLSNKNWNVLTLYWIGMRSPSDNETPERRVIKDY